MLVKLNRTDRRAGLAAALLAALAVGGMTEAPAQPARGTAPLGGEPQGTQAHWRPRVIASSPRAGTSAVDPVIRQISVTFDQDMGTEISWTGRANTAEFPATPAGQSAHWRDRRTCVLPVNKRPAEGCPPIRSIIPSRPGRSPDIS